MTSAGDDQPGVEPHGAPGHLDDVAVSGARTSRASYQEDDREGHRSRQPSLSDADHAGAAKSGVTASTSRPSLLAFSSTAGKGSSTSFTSATTVPWMPRSVSSLSISSHRGGQDRKDSQHVQRHASSSLSTPRRIAHRSLPASPTRRSNGGHNAMQAGESSQQECNVVEVASTEDFHSDSKTGVELEDSMGSFPVDNIDDNEVPVDNASSGDEEAVIWPMKAEMDPRVALREQLRRSESARLHFDSGRTRADSYRSVKSATSSLRSALAVNPWADEVSPAYENVPYAAPVVDTVQSNPVELDNRTPRRYFVLTSAGKPVFSR